MNLLRRYMSLTTIPMDITSFFIESCQPKEFFSQLFLTTS